MYECLRQQTHISYKKLPKLVVVQLIDWQKKKIAWRVSFSYSTLLKTKIANAHICRRLFIYLLFSLIVVIVLGKYIGSSSTQWKIYIYSFHHLITRGPLGQLKGNSSLQRPPSFVEPQRPRTSQSFVFLYVCHQSFLRVWINK